MKTVAVIQAGIGATRLLGKALMPTGGATMLAHVVEYTRCVRRLKAVAVATTVNPTDDASLPNAQRV